MKKILLSAIALIALTAGTAQVYTASDTVAFQAWTAGDLDGDGIGWTLADLSGGGSALASQAGCAISNSWTSGAGALTPDNIFISPAIDCSTGSSVSLTWGAGSIESTASGWYQEHYAVYIVTNIAAVVAGSFPSPVFETTLAAGETMSTETVDISAIADGQSSVYIVFRHFNTTDMNFLVIDDVAVNGDFASVEEKDLAVLSVYPNPTTDLLNITLNEAVSSISIMTMDGKIVANNNEVNSTNASISVAELEAGIYIYEVTTKDGRKVRNSFVKQ